jgi:hypothetical protein
MQHHHLCIAHNYWSSGRAEPFQRNVLNTHEYASRLTGSPVKDEIEQRHLGLPPHLLSTSLLGWDGIAEATEGLGLFPGDTLVDLACGRGGYGPEVAARTGPGWWGLTSSPRRCARPASRRGGSAQRRTSA